MAVTINGTTGILAPDIGIDGTTLTVDAVNNRVGIATSSPGVPLDVIGTIQSDTGLQVAGHPVVGYATISGGYATRLGSTGSTTLNKTQIYARGAEVATFDGATGSVGIGTDTPQEKLHLDTGTLLVTNTSAPQIRLSADNTDASDNDRTMLGQATANSHFVNTAVDNDTVLRGTSTGNILFGVGTSEKLRIDSSGNLIVGQTTQYGVGGGGNTVATFTNTANHRTNLTISNQHSGSGAGAALALASYGVDWILESTSIAKDSKALTITEGTNERLRISSGGNVLIGTTNATIFNQNSEEGIVLRDGEVIDIARSGDLQLTLNRMSNEGPNIALYQAGGFKGTIGTKGGGIYFGTNGDIERLRIDSSGRLGINDGSRPASDANEGAQLRVTGVPITRNQYYSPEGNYYGSFGYTDNTYAKSWIAVDSSYAKSSAVSAGIFLSAFHQDAGGSGCGFTIKNLKNGNPLVISSVVTAASVNNPAVETERLRISSVGGVTIGSGNNDATWSEFGSNTGGLKIDDVGVSNTGLRLSHGNDDTYLVQSSNSNFYISQYGTGSMIFGVGSSGNERLRIDSVARFINSTGTLKISSSTSNDSGRIVLQEIGIDAWSIDGERANATFSIKDEYNNKERFSISNVGKINVGLNVTLRENTTDAFSLSSNGANGYFRLIDEYDSVELMRFHGDGALSINTTNLTNYGQTSNSLNTNNTGGAAGNWSWRRDTGAVIQATDADSGWALMYLNKYEWNSGDDSRWISFYLNGQVRDTISWNGSNIIYGQGSDYRVKENIREFTNGIDKVKQLKVHLYDYIDPDRGTDHIGFIAHELQEIIPEAVSGEKDGMRKEEDTGNDVMDVQMVDYGKLTPVLTAALQEALAKIEALEQRLTDAGL